MALELVMNLEKCFGINIPLSGSSGSMTISEIADQIIAHAGLDREEAIVEKIAGQYRGEVGPAQREALFAFARLPPSQWRSLRTTNAIERSSGCRRSSSGGSKPKPCCRKPTPPR